AKQRTMRANAWRNIRRTGVPLATLSNQAPKRVGSGLFRGLCVRASGGNFQFELGAAAELTLDGQTGADQLGSLVHSWEPIVTWAAFVQDRWIDSFSVIGDQNPEQPPRVLDPDFDPRCLRVKEGVSYCLRGDPIDIVADERSQM